MIVQRPRHHSCWSKASWTCSLSALSKSLWRICGFKLWGELDAFVGFSSSRNENKSLPGATGQDTIPNISLWIMNSETNRVARIHPFLWNDNTEKVTIWIWISRILNFAWKSSFLGSSPSLWRVNIPSRSLWDQQENESTMHLAPLKCSNKINPSSERLENFKTLKLQRGNAMNFY